MSETERAMVVAGERFDRAVREIVTNIERAAESLRTPVPGPFDRHVLTLDFDDGYSNLSVACPYDRADEARPCWPHDPDGDDDLSPLPAPQDVCTYESWVDNVAPDDLLHGKWSVRLDCEWEWDSGEPVVHVRRAVGL